MASHSELFVALTEALIPPDDPAIPAAARDTVVRDAAAFAHEEVRNLPWRLFVLMNVGLAVFRAAIRLRYFRGYCRLPLDERRRILAWWAYGPLSLARQLFRPIRSTALLAGYEHDAVSRAGASR